MAIDHHIARPTDPLAAVMLKRHRLFTGQNQALIHPIEHFQKRHVGADILGFIGRKLHGLGLGGQPGAFMAAQQRGSHVGVVRGDGLLDDDAVVASDVGNCQMWARTYRRIVGLGVS